MSPWYSLDCAAIVAHLESDADKGLLPHEVASRLQTNGPNTITEGNRVSPWSLLAQQFRATLVLVLIAAAIVSALLGDWKEAIAIAVIVVLNAALGFTQEYRSEQAIAALKQLSIPSVRVKREGQVQEISASELVVGDLVLLEAGNRVPADGRLIEAVNMQIAEAPLTGEAVAISKTTTAIEAENLPLGDRINMAYSGTTVTNGRGTLVVTATGMGTELGKIAAAVRSAQAEPTPLQQRLDRVGKSLSIAIMGLVGVIFVVGVGQGGSWQEMFLTAVSLAVAAVPEGLPAVVTIALALGAQRMLKQRALLRNLPAVETLGSVTTICSDKTGTLTENRMVVTHLHWGAQQVPVQDGGEDLAASDDADLGLMMTVMMLCNDVRQEGNGQPSKPKRNGLIGDATEIALVEVAQTFALEKANLDRLIPRIGEYPFDSDRKRMSTLHQLPISGAELPTVVAAAYETHLNPGGVCLCIKGALDRLLDSCDHQLIDGTIQPLTDQTRQQVNMQGERLAQQGSRVLGIAFRTWLEVPNPLPVEPEQMEQQAIFIGLVGMSDPIRKEAQSAVATCRSAGIRPIMITGDHPLTALNIAAQLGITNPRNPQTSLPQSAACTGLQLDALSSQELISTSSQIAVYARVSPQNKLDIVKSLQSQGQIVAMTGDGVNDAPALKKANIGVAMGITGTDVAKEAADMVLLDDNFNTIVAAIKEGRVIFDNIRKFIKFTLTGNCGELFAIAFAPLFGMPFLLLPLQILWINLLGDGLLALALSVEPAERDVMQRPPYPPHESIWARGVGRDIAWVGVMLGLVLLLVGFGYWRVEADHWQTMVFATLAFSRIGLALVMRTENEGILSVGFGSNPVMLGAIAITFLLQLLALYTIPLQSLFETIPLGVTDLLICLGVSFGVAITFEASKGIVNR